MIRLTRSRIDVQCRALRKRAIRASALSVCLRRAVSVVFRSPDKTRQSRYDHHCSNSRPLALAAHSRTLNDFGSLEYPYRADRTKHKPDDRSSPHRSLPSRHKDPDFATTWSIGGAPPVFVPARASQPRRPETGNARNPRRALSRSEPVRHRLSFGDEAKLCAPGLLTADAAPCASAAGPWR